MFHDQLFSIKLLIESRREFNLKTHLSFLDYVTDFDKLQETNCLKLQSKIFPIYYLKLYIRNLLWKRNKSKTLLSQTHTINHRVKDGCPLLPTLFNIYRKEIKVKWNQIYTKGIFVLTSQKINALISSTRSSHNI
jgi:hypothetical protein